MIQETQQLSFENGKWYKYSLGETPLIPIRCFSIEPNSAYFASRSLAATWGQDKKNSISVIRLNQGEYLIDGNKIIAIGSQHIEFFFKPYSLSEKFREIFSHYFYKLFPFHIVSSLPNFKATGENRK